MSLVSLPSSTWKSLVASLRLWELPWIRRKILPIPPHLLLPPSFTTMLLSRKALHRVYLSWSRKDALFSSVASSSARCSTTILERRASSSLAAVRPCRGRGRSRPSSDRWQCQISSWECHEGEFATACRLKLFHPSSVTALC